VHSRRDSRWTRSSKEPFSVPCATSRSLCQLYRSLNRNISSLEQSVGCRDGFDEEFFITSPSPCQMAFGMLIGSAWTD
jgi:hypothetical protein